MQTKFKWTPEQRLLMIGGISLGVTMTSTIEQAHILAEDIYLFSIASSEIINKDESIQSKLKNVFIQSKLKNVCDKNINIYEELLKLEKTEDDDQISLSA